ncbi:MAG: bacteriocin [Bacteroidota bacterium]
MFNKKSKQTKESKIKVLTSKELSSVQGGFEYKNIEIEKAPPLPDMPIEEVTLKQKI